MEKLPQVFGKPTVFLGGGGLLAYQVWEFLPCSHILRSKIESVWQPKSTQRFFATQFPAAANKSACGQFCMEVSETVAPAACESALAVSSARK